MRHASENPIPQSSSSSNLEFNRTYPAPPITIRTGLTTEHIAKVARWEESVWGENPKPFEATFAQLHQEIGEAMEIWTDVLDGRRSLQDDHTLHNLRAEIGDGVFASIGVLRRVVKDDEKVAGILHKQLNQSQAEKRSIEARVSLYGIKGQRYVNRVMSTRLMIPEEFTSSYRNEVVLGASSVMKAGIEGLESLGLEIGPLITDVVRINQLKYRPEIVAQSGARVAKDRWNDFQLPVVSSGGVIIDLGEAA
jgi:hypothetical protein